MGLSHTIAREKLFEPLRKAFGGMSTWRGYFVSCAYCASHWLAFLLVPLTGAYGIHVAPRWPVVSPILDWSLSSILVTVIAAAVPFSSPSVSRAWRLGPSTPWVTATGVLWAPRA